MAETAETTVIAEETVGTAGMTAVMIAEIHIGMTDVTAGETGATAGETGTTTAGETVLERGRLTGGDGSTANALISVKQSHRFRRI